MLDGEHSIYTRHNYMKAVALRMMAVVMEMMDGDDGSGGRSGSRSSGGDSGRGSR